MKTLTSSVYSFSDLILGNFLYIDKTEYIWKLIQDPKAMYFLSRPRRFGKSLTVSTLEAVFNGEKELFKGLALYDKPYDWKKHPVIRLDFGDIAAGTPEILAKSLAGRMTALAESFGVRLSAETAQAQFRELITILSQQGLVVILIDEYDKPILGNATNSDVGGILKVLKGFYSVIKTTAEMQRLVFMTGVSKFAHVSVFSDLNNLTDITMEAEFAAMLGYTQEELEFYFADRIEQLVEEKKKDRKQLLGEMKQWYNGYRFEENAATVYNPVSIAQFFRNGGKFDNYWFATGTPTFLLELAKKSRFDFENALTQPVSRIVFDSYEIDNLDVLALLFQTGYLTIKGTEEEFGRTFYRLGFPNYEVEEAFNTYLLSHYTTISREQVDNVCVTLAQQVRSGDLESFMKVLKNFFARIPYDLHLKNEKYYQTIYFTLFLMLGLYIEAESRTNDGRIDAVASCGEWLYLFEFKLDKNAEIALEQIREKEYFQKYLHSGKRIVLVGVNFNSETGQIDDWQKEDLVI